MELSEKVSAVLRRAVDEGLVAGANVLVEKDGRELCYCQEGMADREKGRPMSRDTIFRLYSQTKPVTAVAAMILMERGLLDLCQPVSDYLPSFRGQKVWRNKTAEPLAAGEREMLVQDLLRMTSGLVYEDNETEPGRRVGAVFAELERRMETDRPMTTRQVADALAACPLAFAPGTSWRYGTSADVLGAVIEVASGMSFAEFLRQELFVPLRMEDTAFWVPREKQGRLAAVYETVKEADGSSRVKRYEEDHLGINRMMDREPAYAAGGAGLASTLDDYMRFARMLLQGGSLDGARILQKRTVEFLTGAELMPCQQQSFYSWIGLDGYSYGNLMRVCKRPGQAGFLTGEGEYGWDGWLGAYFANFPRENMTILMGMQKKDAGTFSLTRKLRNTILQMV
ncbi:MAG: serine hydrolase domain-containing protein [Eubacteriales bacterium]|nr:serine hydrolase domain-containing protein [Eubacteriales bacterium]